MMMSGRQHLTSKVGILSCLEIKDMMLFYIWLLVLMAQKKNFQQKNLRLLRMILRKKLSLMKKFKMLGMDIHMKSLSLIVGKDCKVKLMRFNYYLFLSISKVYTHVQQFVGLPITSKIFKKYLIDSKIQFPNDIDFNQFDVEEVIFNSKLYINNKTFL